MTELRNFSFFSVSLEPCQVNQANYVDLIEHAAGSRQAASLTLATPPSHSILPSACCTRAATEITLAPGRRTWTSLSAAKWNARPEKRRRKKRKKEKQGRSWQIFRWHFIKSRNPLTFTATPTHPQLHSDGGGNPPASSSFANYTLFLNALKRSNTLEGVEQGLTIFWQGLASLVLCKPCIKYNKEIP